MDPIDQAKSDRDQALVAEIRKELRHGRVATVIGFAAFVAAVLLIAFDVLGDIDRLPLLVGLGIVLLASGRAPQRERLLNKAAERLARKND